MTQDDLSEMIDSTKRIVKRHEEGWHKSHRKVRVLKQHRGKANKAHSEPTESAQTRSDEVENKPFCRTRELAANGDTSVETDYRLAKLAARDVLAGTLSPAESNGAMKALQQSINVARNADVSAGLEARCVEKDRREARAQTQASAPHIPSELDIAEAEAVAAQANADAAAARLAAMRAQAQPHRGNGHPVNA